MVEKKKKEKKALEKNFVLQKGCRFWGFFAIPPFLWKIWGL